MTTTTNGSDPSNEPNAAPTTPAGDDKTHDRDDNEKMKMKIEEQLQVIGEGEINELEVVAEGEERTNYFIWLLVACSTISGLLFGEYSLYISFDVRRQ
jgi:SP family myo-inositol transporter-like MFS transporter 13